MPELEFLDSSLDSPAANLALDEALLVEREELVRSAGDEHAPEILRIWESPVPFVVLGSAGRIDDEVKREATQAAGVAVLRRASGGGTVLQGPGCVNFALILSVSRPGYRNYRQSYGEILGTVAEALDLPALEFSGTSDLAIDGRKFSGNAQKRKRWSLLHHGTLLYGFDIRHIARFLTEPEKRPDYRGARTHDEFVRNLPLDRVEIVERLRRAWSATTDRKRPLPVLTGLLADKYENPAWTERL